tara:strand:- start:607 stop:861 length:255 start_codon:yes stop_codon:yes gene_type:complete
MTKSTTGEIWFDLYDAVAMLQALGNQNTSYEEDQALEQIVKVLDTQLTGWHERMMDEMLLSLSEEDLNDLQDFLKGENYDEDED